MPYRCRDCRKWFSVKTGTVMQSSKLGLQRWVLASYLLNLLTTGIKGQASMKLHRDLGVTQKTAWHLAHRIRETWAKADSPPFAGPVEVDGTYIGGRRKNIPKAKQAKFEGRGAVGKVVVADAKDRTTKRVSAKGVDTTDGPTLKGFVRSTAEAGVAVFTDGACAYCGLASFWHESVNHSVGKYLRGMAQTNSVESFWAMLKRGYHRTFHHFSAKYMQRYVNEFAEWHNVRPRDTLDQMAGMAEGVVGKRLMYRELVA